MSNLSSGVMPVEMTLEYADGSTETVVWPASVWAGTRTTTSAVPDVRGADEGHDRRGRQLSGSRSIQQRVGSGRRLIRSPAKPGPSEWQELTRKTEKSGRATRGTSGRRPRSFSNGTIARPPPGGGSSSTASRAGPRVAARACGYGLTRDEVTFLAKAMELKFAFAGPPIGGAKSGIDFDPADPRKKEVLDPLVPGDPVRTPRQVRYGGRPECERDRGGHPPVP